MRDSPAMSGRYSVTDRYRYQPPSCYGSLRIGNPEREGVVPQYGTSAIT